MTPKHLLTTTAVSASLALGSLVVTPITAHANPSPSRSAGCTEVNAIPDRPTFELRGQFLSPQAFTAGETVTVRADSVALSLGSISGVLWQFDTNASTGPFSAVAGTPESANPVSASITVPTGGSNGLGWQPTTAAAVAASGVRFTNLSFSCDPFVALATPVGIPVGDVAQVAAATQHRSIGGTVARTASARLRGTQTNTATRAFTFLSTSGQSDGTGQPLNAWVSFGARGYFDRLEGETTHLTFGIDYSVSANTLVGVMVGIDQTSLENDAGQGTDSDSLLLGLYGAHSFGDLIVEGYVAHASVDYDIPGGASFETDRTLAGLTLSGQYALAVGTVTPRAQLRATWEDFPTGVTGLVGGTSRQLQASVGAEIAFNTALAGTDLFPFASLDMEYSTIDEVGRATDDIFAPRIGLGVEGRLGAGHLRAALDVGRSAASVTDVGLELAFELRF